MDDCWGADCLSGSLSMSGGGRELFIIIIIIFVARERESGELRRLCV